MVGVTKTYKTFISSKHFNFFKKILDHNKKHFNIYNYKNNHSQKLANRTNHRNQSIKKQLYKIELFFICAGNNYLAETVFSNNLSSS